MTVVEESAQTYTLRAAAIQISFRYVGDRWQHLVSVRCNDHWSLLLSSEEGSPARSALPSPALQDLRLERLPDGVFEFQALGQAAKCVYSAAVRFDAKSQEIDFDLCSRGRSIDSPLCTQSAYLLGDGIQIPTVEILQPNALVVRLQDGEAIEISPVFIPEIPPTECRVADDQPAPKIIAGSFGIARPGIANKGFSVRWRYRIAPFGDP